MGGKLTREKLRFIIIFLLYALEHSYPITNKYFMLVIFEVVGMLCSELPNYFIDCFNIVNGAERQ